MKILKHETRATQGPVYYADTFSTRERKNHLGVFVRGKGMVWLQKKHVTRMEIEVAQKWSYGEIRRLIDEYGMHVANHYADKHIPCAGVCVPVYLVIARDCSNPTFLDEIKEKTGFDVYKGSYQFAVFGLFVFPLMEFDDHLHEAHGYEEDKHGSMQEFIIQKWGEEFCKKLESLWATSAKTNES